MSARASVRTLVLATAVVWLFAANHAIAQTPPAAPDAEQRLKALEDKMDRVLKLMEARTAPLPAKGSAASAIEAARDKVKAELQAKEAEHTEFRRKSPYMNTPDAGKSLSLIVERLGKIEGRRSELRIKMLEIADQLARVERAYKNGGAENGNKAALHVIRAMGINAKGLDEHPAETIIEQLDRERKKLVTSRSEKDPGVGDVDIAIALVRKIYAGREGPDAREYINMMKEEINDLSTRIMTLENMVDAETKTAREMTNFQGNEDRLLREIGGLRNRLKVLDSLLSGDEVQKPK
jgi:hypothetical protein